MTRLVKYLSTYVRIITSDHLAVRDLIADAVARLVGIVSPFTVRRLLHDHSVLVDVRRRHFIGVVAVRGELVDDAAAGSLRRMGCAHAVDGRDFLLVTLRVAAGRC